MSVFSRRLKQGRSWCEKGLDKFVDVMVGLKDNLEIKTLQGRFEKSEADDTQQRPPTPQARSINEMNRLQYIHGQLYK